MSPMHQYLNNDKKSFLEFSFPVEHQKLLMTHPALQGLY